MKMVPTLQNLHIECVFVNIKTKSSVPFDDIRWKLRGILCQIIFTLASDITVSDIRIIYFNIKNDIMNVIAAIT